MVRVGEGGVLTSDDGCVEGDLRHFLLPFLLHCAELGSSGGERDRERDTHGEIHSLILISLKRTLSQLTSDCTLD